MPKPQRGRSPQQDTSAPDTRVRARPKGPSKVDGVARRATYPEAVAGYERGMRALQEHRYSEAAEAFRAVLAQFPEEKELNDRVRLYLAVCERNLQSTPEPKTLDELVYAATLALNTGDRITALRHLTDVVAQDPNHDGALYMLCVAYALSDDRDEALSYLQRAIEQNPANRALALQDADLERLMQDEAARAAVQTATTRRSNVRTPLPHRPIR